MIVRGRGTPGGGARSARRRPQTKTSNFEFDPRVPLMRRDVERVKPAAFTQHPRPAYYEREPGRRPAAMGVSVRTDKVRSTEWRDWTSGDTIARELCDHVADPSERANVVEQLAFTADREAAAQLLWARFPLTKHAAPPPPPSR